VGKAARRDVWLKCPKCGRASQPPDGAVTPETPASAPAPREDLIFIGPESEPAPAPAPQTAAGPAPVPAPAPVGPAPVVSARARRDEPEPASPVRVAMAAGLFVAVVLLVFSILEQSMTAATVFSVAAGLLLVGLAVPTGGGRPV
jgi:hypothetical protein